MLAMNPKTVKDSVLPSLVSTRLGPEDLAIWRNGHKDARRVTPLGYFGDPATDFHRAPVRRATFTSR
ncbi:MAG: hypothetical protein AB7E21_07980 [Pseudodonghicola sp.]